MYAHSASLDITSRLWTTDLVFPLRVLAGHTASGDVSTLKEDDLLTKLQVMLFHGFLGFIVMASASCDQTC